MIEIAIHGRGGGGGVTLAKLIAGAFFLRNSYVQAFGVYGAERSGAPVQAYVRIDDVDITLHGPIARPDHVVIIDPSLIAPEAASGMKADGWVVLNSPEDPSRFASQFPGRRLASIDASAIAVAHQLGSTTLPIVNTTMLGAVIKLLGLDFSDVEGALALAKFGGPNLEAARAAFDSVRTQAAAGVRAESVPRASVAALGFFDRSAGTPPIIRTGEWASRRPASRELSALCGGACPAGNDVRGFLQAAAAGDRDRALAIILETSPFPGTCGRVCPAPCMTACNRTLLDEAVNVREVERAVAERATPPSVAGRPTRSEQVAVVGSGPAGLTAAYHLARAGFRVTVLEASSEIGGVLRSGIPAYRLPRDVLDREIAFIQAHGVDVRVDHPVDRDEIERLSRTHAAVFIAMGCSSPRDIELGCAGAARVEQGLEFLDSVRRGRADLSDKRVVVVGGGNTAMDAARSALRSGAESVRVVYRRTRAEMPAIADEIEEALEEGVEIGELLAPLRLQEDEGGVKLTCRRTTLEEADESGRRRPVPVDGDEGLLDLSCDAVLLALGQSADRSVLPVGAEPRDRQAIADLGPALVLAGGDFVGGEGTVAAAIGSGRRAAAHIASVLTGDEADGPCTRPSAGPEDVALERFPRTPQHRGTSLPAAERRRNFDEVRCGMISLGDEDAAAEEAARCLCCGACNGCGTCVAYCPEGVVRDVSDGSCTFDYEYCKGCGFCAAQCPRGAIAMEFDRMAAVP